MKVVLHSSTHEVLLNEKLQQKLDFRLRLIDCVVLVPGGMGGGVTTASRFEGQSTATICFTGRAWSGRQNGDRNVHT